MLTYIAKRFLTMLFTVFAVSLLAFGLIQLPPGDYVATMVSQVAGAGAEVPPELEERLRESYGFNQPVYVQYYKWVRGIVTEGEFGYS